jgi:hypothetical protein
MKQTLKVESALDVVEERFDCSKLELQLKNWEPSTNFKFKNCKKEFEISEKTSQITFFTLSSSLCRLFATAGKPEASAQVIVVRFIYMVGLEVSIGICSFCNFGDS